MTKKKSLPKGTKRIKSKDFKQYEKTSKDWILDNNIPEHTRKIIEHYLKEKSHKTLLDEKEKDFLKGILLPLEKVSGARIKTLPNGKNLARGGFSIYAKNIEYNPKNNPQWDICYENTSGLKTYLYSEDKIHLEQKQKYKLVQKFKENYEKILTKLEKDIKETQNLEHIALYILLLTKIRVGNEHHFHHTGHKGLTTLQKFDLELKNNHLTLNFIGKDGVPQHIEKELPEFIAKLLKIRLENIKNDDFVFANIKGEPIHPSHFSDILFEYTNEHFYPHIIRSHYADTTCEEFLNSCRKPTKEEVEKVFLEVAKNLGHKKYNKKKNIWEINYKVTLENYIYPKLSEKMLKRVK